MPTYEISTTQINLIKKIRTSEIDINNVSNFFSIFIKAFIVSLNEKIKIRDKKVPHFIVHVGDINKYLDVKNHDSSIEPLEISNEDYVYTEIPRCNITPGGITFLSDQVTSPYSHGNLVYQYDDILYTFCGEFRRIPIQMTFELNYTLDSYTDSLALIQQCLSKLIYIQTFSFIYLGQKINASYNIPNSYSDNHLNEITGSVTDELKHSIEYSIEVETYFPVWNEKTIVGESKIRHITLGVIDNKNKILLNETSHINGDFTVSHPWNEMKFTSGWNIIIDSVTFSNTSILDDFENPKSGTPVIEYSIIRSYTDDTEEDITSTAHINVTYQISDTENFSIDEETGEVSITENEIDRDITTEVTITISYNNLVSNTYTLTITRKRNLWLFNITIKPIVINKPGYIPQDIITYYSIDDGTTWNVYLEPLVLKYGTLISYFIEGENYISNIYREYYLPNKKMIYWPQIPEGISKYIVTKDDVIEYELIQIYSDDSSFDDSSFDIF